MRGRKSALKLVLSDEERRTLRQWARSTTTAAGLARRARIVLLVAEGNSLSGTARQVDVMETVVRLWCTRFLKQRLDGLSDLPRSGRPRDFSPSSGDVRREDRVRTAGCSGAIAVSVGWSGNST